jgi:hypothetical protein
MHTNGFTMNKIPRTNEEDLCFVVNTCQCVFTSLWKKKVFHNLACNSIFELQLPFVIHYISTPMNAIEQVAWVARDGTHHIYVILMQFITILLQQLLLFNYYATPLWL